MRVFPNRVGTSRPGGCASSPNLWALYSGSRERPPSASDSVTQVCPLRRPGVAVAEGARRGILRKSTAVDLRTSTGLRVVPGGPRTVILAAADGRVEPNGVASLTPLDGYHGPTTYGIGVRSRNSAELALNAFRSAAPATTWGMPDAELARKV